MLDWPGDPLLIAVLLFTALTLVATLIHLDRFHFGAPLFITRAGTWVWLAVYAGVPVAMSVLLALQLPAPGGDPVREAPLPRWVRLVAGLQGLVMLVLGAALFLMPQVTAPLWPWTLSALTGRAIGAWLIGVGTSAVHMVWENDWPRVKAAMLSYALFGLLEILAVLRYSGTPDWSSPGAWVYAAFLLSVAAVGLYGWLASRRPAAGGSAIA